jgi:hypothetical protein
MLIDVGDTHAIARRLGPSPPVVHGGYIIELPLGKGLATQRTEQPMEGIYTRIRNYWNLSLSLSSGGPLLLASSRVKANSSPKTAPLANEGIKMQILENKHLKDTSTEC